MKHIPSYAVVLLLASTGVPAQPPQAKPPDSVEAIAAAHQKIDEGYKRSLMSPFTAIGVQYFEPGQRLHLIAGATGVTFESPTAPGAGVEISFSDGAFAVTPLRGTAVTLLARTGEGDVVTGAGRPVAGATPITDRDVLKVGRYYVESYARPDSGNVRAFDPDSAARQAFAGLKWFPPNAAFQLAATYTPIATPAKVVIATSRGLKKDYFRVGVFAFTVDGTPQTLTALAVSASPGTGDELFVPFRDATTGNESYEVGRYLMVAFLGPGASYVLDFNQATNPLCNYSPHYNCPIPPRENTLAVAVRAGEMAYPRPHQQGGGQGPDQAATGRVGARSPAPPASGRSSSPGL